MSKSDSPSSQEYEIIDMNIKENFENSKRTGKIITNALCTLIQVSSSINTRLQTIQNATDEINLIRQEVLEMNRKLDRILELAEKTPDKSTFVNYLLS